MDAQTTSNTRFARLRYGVVTLAMCASLGAGALAIFGTANAAPNNGSYTAGDTRSCEKIKKDFQTDFNLWANAKDAKTKLFFQMSAGADQDSFSAKGCKGNITEITVQNGASLSGLTTSAVTSRAQ